MFLDPDAQIVLDMIKAAGRPAFNTLTPAEARGFLTMGRIIRASATLIDMMAAALRRAWAG